MFNLIVIGTLGGPESRALAIDPFRRVAGAADAAPDSEPHALLFDGGAQDLGVLQLVDPLAIPGDGQLLFSMARGISALPGGGAMVVGFSGVRGVSTGAGLDRGFFQTNGPMQEIGTLVPIPVPSIPGLFFGSSKANAANNQGLVVGYADTLPLSASLDPTRHAFVFDTSSGQMSDLGTLVPDPNNPGQFLGNSEAKGINSQGQIVGVSDTGQFDANNQPIRHAFFFDLNAGQMQDLGTLLPDPNNPGLFLGSSEARAINNQGQIVGMSDSADPAGGSVQRAFLLNSSSAQMRDLGTLVPDPNNPGQFLGNSAANAINDNGVVVGVADTDALDANGNRISHGFMWDPTVHHPEDLNDPPLPGGATLLEATGINNPVDICGLGVDAAGTKRGMLLFV
jgi:probable HAF family extracellular repeat protein